jgi:apolipoprotein N-acyltransferase
MGGTLRFHLRFSFYTFFNYWLTSFHPLAIYIVTIIKGGEMVFLFLALKASSVFFKKRSFWIEGAIWVSYAYLSENWFAGYPYGTVCYALYRYLPLLQIAEYTGIWAIIFMMIVPQAFIASCLSERESQVNAVFKNYGFDIILYAVLFVLWVITGTVSLKYWEKAEPDKTWRVAAIQHNHDSWKGGLQTYKINFNNLRRLSLEALKEDPQMILWSETAFVPSVEWHTNYRYEGSDFIIGNAETVKLVDEFVRFGEELPVPLITGNPEGVLKDPNEGPVDAEGKLNRTDYNSVIYFSNGKIAQTYRKQHLVPFTEHFPYEKQLPLLYKILLANDYNWWEKGTESVVFTSPEGVTFSTPICFEDVFGYLPAGFVRSGANVIVNMTNDRWSGAESAELQHCAIATLRSIETRKSTIRGTNSGITCLIPPTGKIVDPMEPFKMAYHIYDVPVYETATYGETFYVRHTDLFAFLAIYASVAFLVLGLAITLLGRFRGKKKND